MVAYLMEFSLQPRTSIYKCKGSFRVCVHKRLWRVSMWSHLTFCIKHDNTWDWRQPQSCFTEAVGWDASYWSQFFFNDNVFCFFCFVLLFSHFQRPHKAYPVELAQFHSVDYVEFLGRITPESQEKYAAELIRCTLSGPWMTLQYILMSLSFTCFPSNVDISAIFDFSHHSWCIVGV